MDYKSISENIKTGSRVIYFDEIDSTNSYAKTLLAEGENISLPLAIVSNAQSDGRGRLGRQFSSPAGSGIYLSVIIETRLSADSLTLLTMAAAVATRRAIEKICDVSPEIKWVNDLFLEDKKICGILLETATSLKPSQDGVTPIVIGIGINCFPGSFPEEIKDIAGCISNDINSFSRSELAARVIDEVVFECAELDASLDADPHTKESTIDFMLSTYRRHCFILGRNVRVTNFSGGTDSDNQKSSPRSFLARAVSVLDNGSLVVEPLDGSPLITLVSGEVSIHLD